MRRLADGLFLLVLTLWVGGIWTVGFIAAPSLFSALDDRALAGELAGRLFALIDWIGIACATYLLPYQFARRRRAAFGSAAFWCLLAMLLLVLVGHFGIQPVLAELKAEVWPRSVMEGASRDRFVVWHGIASGLYAVQSLLGAAAVLLQGRDR